MRLLFELIMKFSTVTTLYPSFALRSVLPLHLHLLPLLPLLLAAATGAPVSCGTALSVCFAIDESSSLSASEFTAVSRALGKFSVDLSRGRNGTVKFAAAGFATHAWTVSAMTGNATAFAETLMDNDQEQGATASGAGLWRCTALLKTVPTEALRVILLVADGPDNRGPRGEVVAPRIKQRGFTLAAVGVGPQSNDTALQTVASTPELYARAQDFDTVDVALARVGHALCLQRQGAPWPASMPSFSLPSLSASPSLSPSLSPSPSPSPSRSASGGYNITDFWPGLLLPSVTPVLTPTASHAAHHCMD